MASQFINSNLKSNRIRIKTLYHTCSLNLLCWNLRHDSLDIFSRYSVLHRLMSCQHGVSQGHFVAVFKHLVLFHYVNQAILSTFLRYNFLSMNQSRCSTFVNQYLDPVMIITIQGIYYLEKCPPYLFT